MYSVRHVVPFWFAMSFLALSGCGPDCSDDDATDTDCNTVLDDDISPQGITMLALAGGTFDIGCTAAQAAGGNCDDDEYPVHSVTLTNNFWLGETEVTQEQWQVLMGNNPSYFPSCGTDCPVETVNWWEALEFANEFSATESLSECYTLSGCTSTPGHGMECSAVAINSPTGSVYDCVGYRLPTEAEWEYAARVGTDLVYAGSDTVDDVAWHDDNSGSTTHPVATKDPNARGLHDMSGNVWEWTSDWFEDYPDIPQTDPEGPVTGSGRSSRGGSWYFDASNSRVANRNHYHPDIRYNYLGFRLSRTTP